jgi:hypothetical protein
MREEFTARASQLGGESESRVIRARNSALFSKRD